MRASVHYGNAALLGELSETLSRLPCAPAAKVATSYFYKVLQSKSGVPFPVLGQVVPDGREEYPSIAAYFQDSRFRITAVAAWDRCDASTKQLAAFTSIFGPPVSRACVPFALGGQSPLAFF